MALSSLNNRIANGGAGQQGTIAMRKIVLLATIVTLVTPPVPALAGPHVIIRGIACEWNNYATTAGGVDIDLNMCIDAMGNGIAHRASADANAPGGQEICGTDVNGDPVGRYWEVTATVTFCFAGTNTVAGYEQGYTNNAF